MHKIIFGVALTWCCTILNAQSKLVFTYDAQGNQLERKYCPSGDCDRGSKQLSEDVETLASSIIVHPAIRYYIYIYLVVSFLFLLLSFM